MIGSRETPDEILDLMGSLAIKLSHEGYTVRSGGANGADECAEEASFIEIYLPWNGFNGKYDNNCFGAGYINYQNLGFDEKLESLCMTHHKWWLTTNSVGAKHLHKRNCHQILGMHLDSPSLFVICYAKPDKDRGVGHVQGGTGTAISLALSEGVEVINLYFEEDLDKVKRWVYE